MDQILKIAAFILDSFIHIWPYLALSVPLAVIARLSGPAGLMSRIFGKNPYISILLGTLIGAVSPFCSCGVIPVVASMLLGGVPLAPVMSFWIASPSMDPEIFLLSVATVGWPLSVWRLVATFTISFGAGLVTHFAARQGYLGAGILRTAIACNDCQTAVLSGPVTVGDCGDAPETGCNAPAEPRLMRKIATESWKAFFLVARFMALAFLINALIVFYVPQDLFARYLGGDGLLSPLFAALLGIPFYTSNATALPLVSGLLSLGMNPGAALAFLIAGPVTTLPAMMAVWGIVKPRVFFLYLSLSFLGALLFGYLFMLVQ